MIKKQDVLNLIADMKSRLSSRGEDEIAEVVLDMVMNKVQGMEEVGEWIPVEERLPEIYTPVLVTYRRITDGYTKVIVASMQFDCEWKILLGGYCDKESILAWMPRPDPYKEEEE